MSQPTTDAAGTETHTARSADGTAIAYEKVGTGPALVLVDGALCYRGFGPCRSLANHLADRFTVYFYDRRGRGESGDTQPYAPEREYEDLAAVINAAGGNAYITGFSSGAALALQAAASGVAMRKLAVYEAPYIGLKEVKGVKPDYLAHLNELVATDKRGAAVGYFMVKIVGGPAFLPIMMRLMPKIWKQLKGVAHTLPNDAAVLGSFDVPADVLANVGVPTLVMGGSKAKPNMARAVSGVADAVPGSTRKTLAGQTHQVADEAIAPELVEFFTVPRS
ncbi:alpha/beta fold hydrolase [Glaciibacter superstes]|uniref:alpha/beta fold hydrolase n=1 Tax=Glaciibacter superstes TaxID=501023 RepID=UPI0003B32A8A|nr:alpha/beta hydrolase [Glaciibacter superstes]